MVLSEKMEVEILVVTLVRPSAESTRFDPESRLPSLYCLQWLLSTDVKIGPLDFLCYQMCVFSGSPFLFRLPQFAIFSAHLLQIASH